MKQLTGLFFALFAVVVMQTQFVGADEWSQWRGENREGVWNETGIIEKFEGPEIPIRWRVPIGSGYSGPSVSLTDGSISPIVSINRNRSNAFTVSIGKPGTKFGLTLTIAYTKSTIQQAPVRMSLSMMDSLTP